MRSSRVIILLLCLAFFQPLAVQASDGETSQVVRIFFPDETALNREAPLLDVWEVDRQANTLLAAVTPAQYTRLQAAGYRLEVDTSRSRMLFQQNTALPAQPSGIPGYPCYRTVEETYTSLAALAQVYPTLAQVKDIGDSWNKINSGGKKGYDLLVLRLTNQNITGSKPVMFLIAAIHAREYATAETALRFGENLLQQYGTNPDITWLLNNFEVHILPQANPDGRKIAEKGYYQRKNVNDQNGGSCSAKPATMNQFGTDLNRNSSFHWDWANGSSDNPCDETYRGPAAQSEPETQAIEAYARSILPDRRDENTTEASPVDYEGLFLTLHAYGGQVMYPWGDSASPAPNAAGLKTLAERLAFYAGYDSGQSSGLLYYTTGATDDWAYGMLGVPAFTIEMGKTFFESCSDFENVVYPANEKSLLYAFKTARRPYQTPAGPEVTGLTVSPVSFSFPSPLTVNALADSSHFWPGQEDKIIRAAQYSLDQPSWMGGTSVPLLAADGLFDSSSENITAVLDPTGWAFGKHILYVEAQTADGSWGVPTAVFVNYFRSDYQNFFPLLSQQP